MAHAQAIRHSSSREHVPHVHVLFAWSSAFSLPAIEKDRRHVHDRDLTRYVSIDRGYLHLTDIHHSYFIQQPNHLVLRIGAIQVNPKHATLHHPNRCRRHSLGGPHGPIEIPHSPRIRLVGNTDYLPSRRGRSICFVSLLDRERTRLTMGLGCLLAERV